MDVGEGIYAAALVEPRVIDKCSSHESVRDVGCAAVGLLLSSFFDTIPDMSG